MDTLRSRGRLQSMLSREAMFLLQNVLFLVVAAITLWGTIFPVLSEAVDSNTVTVGEPFYNRTAGPVLLGIIVLMGGWAAVSVAAGHGPQPGPGSRRAACGGGP